MPDLTPSSLVPVTDAALFLDLDGAIVPLQDDPDAVRAAPSCRIVLKRALDHLGGRLAVISGRTIASVDDVLGNCVPCVAGVHGLQRRTADGKLSLSPAHARVAEAAVVLETLALACPGLSVEAKGPSVAIHYRAAPDAAEAVLEAVDRLAQSSGLEVQLGKMVAELRTPGPNKGSAVDRFMREAPFRNARPIFIGDDLTDEAGFAAANQHGGFGILVGDRRRSFAAGRLANPEATLSWIMRALDRGAFPLWEVEWVA